MDVDDLPVRGEWAVGSTAAIALKGLLWLSVLGAVLLLVLAVRRLPLRGRR